MECKQIYNNCAHFLSRWVRLLLSREFPLPDTFVIWDALFAHEPTLSLLDELCVAMLVYVKDYRTTLLEFLIFHLKKCYIETTPIPSLC